MKKLLIILTLLNFALLFAATGEYDGTSKYGTATMDVSANVQTMANNNGRVYFGFTTSGETGNTISHMTTNLVLTKNFQTSTTYVATGTVYCFFRIAYKQSLKCTLSWSSMKDSKNKSTTFEVYKVSGGTSTKLTSNTTVLYTYNPANGLVVDDRVELKLTTGSTPVSTTLTSRQMTSTLTLTVATV